MKNRIKVVVAFVSLFVFSYLCLSNTSNEAQFGMTGVGSYGDLFSCAPLHGPALWLAARVAPVVLLPIRASIRGTTAITGGWVPRLRSFAFPFGFSVAGVKLNFLYLAAWNTALWAALYCCLRHGIVAWVRARARSGEPIPK